MWSHLARRARTLPNLTASRRAYQTDRPRLDPWIGPELRQADGVVASSPQALIDRIQPLFERFNARRYDKLNHVATFLEHLDRTRAVRPDVSVAEAFATFDMDLVNQEEPYGSNCVGNTEAFVRELPVDIARATALAPHAVVVPERPTSGPTYHHLGARIAWDGGTEHGRGHLYCDFSIMSPAPIVQPEGQAVDISRGALRWTLAPSVDERGATALRLGVKGRAALVSTIGARHLANGGQAISRQAIASTSETKLVAKSSAGRPLAKIVVDTAARTLLLKDERSGAKASVALDSDTAGRAIGDAVHAVFTDFDETFGTDRDAVIQQLRRVAAGLDVQAKLSRQAAAWRRQGNGLVASEN